MRLAHLSDPHIIAWSGIHWLRFRGKRTTGWANFRFVRKGIHQREVFRLLLDDLAEAAPDHVAITGDVSSLGFAEELRAFDGMIRDAGLRPDQVSLIPGNHDAYTHRVWSKGVFLAELGRYCTSDLHGRMPGFPFVRLRGPVALIGLDSAVARPYFVASGLVGAPQLLWLREVLDHSEVRRRLPVILIHHPPRPYPTWSKEVQAGLLDRKRLVEILRRGLAGRPALILCGHWHQTAMTTLIPRGPVEVFQIASASHHGGGPLRSAAYRLIEINDLDRQPTVTHRLRTYDPTLGRVISLTAQVPPSPSGKGGTGG